MSNRNTSLVTIGVMIAICLSYHTNHSVLWALLHGILGWTYNIYWLFEYGHILSKLGLG